MPGLIRPRQRGYIVYDTPEGKVERDTFTCAHHGGIVEVVRGSGERRGWCGNCGRPTCGAKACDPCSPFMKALEAQERSAKLMQTIGRG